MNEQTKNGGIVQLLLLFAGVPMLLYATGGFPRRTFLKEAISIITILAFCQMVAQFYLTRINRMMLSGYRLASIMMIHKFLGYLFVSILIVHPFLIVVPRYFESGIDSKEAFFTIITTVSSPGVVLGISAWTLMLLLGLTSLFRKRIPLKYKNWRRLHGVLAILFIILSSWHALEVGRHSSTLLTYYVIFAVLGGVFPLTKTYFSKTVLEQGRLINDTSYRG